ncbi:hypothetical protein CEXT_174531 [Caerostris extrusa]|uniref:Uncharacterized protein n=1 Tax=Caerostris extrusa TaxID=172846 RepID=A0AAV4XEP3_CAEEX|nr:hypothetical protein CEXT_174531 [Caerostris extrusa]
MIGCCDVMTFEEYYKTLKVATRFKGYRFLINSLKDSTASSLPGSGQTTIAHPGRSRRAATLSPGLVWGKKSSADFTGVQVSWKGKETQSNTDVGHRGATSFNGSMHSEQQVARSAGICGWSLED